MSTGGNNNKQAKVIAITSDKPGVGKSLISKEIVAYIAKHYSGLKTLVIDVDTQNFSVATSFGINEAAANNYNTIIAVHEYYNKGEEFDILEFKNSLYKFDKNKKYNHYFENTFILPMGKPLHSNFFGNISDNDDDEKEVIMNFFLEMKNYFDVIVIDTNSNYMDHPLSYASLVVADEILLVTSNDTNSIKSTKHYSETMKLKAPNFFKRTKLVYNQIPDSFMYQETEDFFTNNVNYFYNFFGTMFRVKKLDQEILDNALISNEFIAVADVEKKQGIFKKVVVEPFDYQFTTDIQNIVCAILQKGGN